MDHPMACAHCLGIINRSGTRWVHVTTGRKACSPGSVHQAQPKAPHPTGEEVLVTGAIYLCGGGRPVPDTESDCPDRDQHTPTPAGYVDHAEWANRMIARGARQRRCPTCQRYAIWTPPGRPMPEEGQ